LVGFKGRGITLEEKALFTEEDINALKTTTILELAQQLENVLTNDLVHEDTPVLEFLQKYFNK
jgi:hypothetical protein